MVWLPKLPLKLEVKTDDDTETHEEAVAHAASVVSRRVSCKHGRKEEPNIDRDVDISLTTV